LIGGESVIHANLKLGEFTAFYLYLNMLVGPMRSLGVTLNLAQRATASGARIFQLLDREPRLTEAPHAPDLPAGSGHVELVEATLRYDNDRELSPTADGQAFGASPDTAYASASGSASGNGGPPSRGAARAVLRGVSLDVPAGRTIALVGATGSGKTSLVSLISRLYDVSDGRVLLDGADVRGLSLRSLRRAIAVVSDDPFLFSASVAENIAYARPDASREEVELAARRAQAHEFVERLPQGYDTGVGERGLSLSGGQRQRLAIARALLANPRVLILDDATSSVDASTEQSIKLALAEAMAGRTTFVIAHRLSTIALADEIAVLDHGRIIAHGSHHELLDTSELYREIVEKGLPESVFMTKDTCEREVSSL
jgi:ATP-binding cassette subfamily B protein